MEYSIQKNFKVIDETITFHSYETSKKIMMELKIKSEFEHLINESDYWDLIEKTDIVQGAVQKLFTYIDENEKEISEKLKFIDYDSIGFDGFNSNHDRNKISFSVLCKKEHQTIEDVKNRLHDLYEEYHEKVIEREEKPKLHPDLAVRLQQYLEENENEVVQKHGQNVFDFLSTVKKISVYTKEDSYWGNDYEVVLECEEDDYTLQFFNSGLDESDAAFLSDDECSSIRVIFATVPIFWD